MMIKARQTPTHSKMNNSLLKYANVIRGISRAAKGIRARPKPINVDWDSRELAKFAPPKVTGVQVTGSANPKNLMSQYKLSDMTYEEFARRLRALQNLTKQGNTFRQGLVGLFNPLRDHVDGKHPKSKIPSYADKLKQNQKFKKRMTPVPAAPAPTAPAPTAPAPDPVKNRFKTRAMSGAYEQGLKI